MVPFFILINNEYHKNVLVYIKFAPTLFICYSSSVTTHCDSLVNSDNMTNKTIIVYVVLINQLISDN
ncbi:hypothetical protein KSF78_0001690 [Schistosoma japonicum]|nr:hypothetical protein KSF78_0001690 [Schistosoma japonicum]